MVTLRQAGGSPPVTHPPRAGGAGFRVSSEETAAALRLAEWLGRQFAVGLRRNHSRLVLLCIGTDRSTGDSLGPLVSFFLGHAGLCQGHSVILEGEGPVPVRRLLIRGTLSDPVHAGNLAQVTADLARTGEGSFVVAVDACLGDLDNVGTVAAGVGPLRPGAGVNKSLPPVGDLHITGTVNVGGFMEYFVLQNTRLSLVFQIARVIAEGLCRAVAGGRCLSVPAAAREAPGP